MFIAGVVSVLAAFAGYVHSGGGEELLRRELARLKYGKAQFSSIKFNWRSGEMAVSNLEHDNFAWPKANPVATFSGLSAANTTVKMDLFPWPPNVTRITIADMPVANRPVVAITLTEDFLQNVTLQGVQETQIPPIEFRNCDINLTLGQFRPLALKGCSAELRRDSRGKLRGNFSLSELNGKPFKFKLETLEDGSWICTGEEIQLDTRGVIAATLNPMAGKLDPVSLLVGALFSGDLGAEGKVTSLRVEVQPAAAGRKFSCHGEVGYQSIEFRLPGADKPAAVAVPFFLDQFLGHDEFWPHWMQVDKIKTGEKGRVEFHMADGRLDFHCDNGPGSAFTGLRQGKTLPRLESLRGTVDTDKEGRPSEIALHGFLGDQLNFETRIDLAADQSRTYQLMLEPRAGDYKRLAFGEPLWRFKSVVADNSNVDKAALNGRTMIAFELEANARHFPLKDLPAGMQDVGGHVYAKGHFTDTQLLRFDTIGVDDGGELVYGGPAEPGKENGSQFGPLWQALQGIFATSSPWKLHDLSLQGEADVQFGPKRQWLSTVLKNWSLVSGSIIHGGLTTDLGIARIQFSANHEQVSTPPFTSKIEVTAAVPGLWKVQLLGDWSSEEGKPAMGEFKLVEESVPLRIHPQRESIEPQFVSTDRRRVNRTTEVHIKDNKVQVETKTSR